MFRRNRWNHFVRIRYASWRRHSSKFRNNSNRQPRMPTTRSLKAGTLLSTASWTRAVTPCFPTASGSASIRFPPSRDILAWSRSSPTRSQDNGSRALRWFLCPRLIPQGVGISMTYMRRYALSAMLGIVTEEDTDGEFNPDKLNRPQKQKNAVNASQRGKTTQDDSGQAKKILSASNRTPDGLSKLPHLDGISYEIVTAQDGRECILATGNTAAKKEQLSAAGFHWNPQRKIWWKYAA